MDDAFDNPQTLRLFSEKIFYKIGEASKIVGVEPYVLRYWETEFSFLKPKKSKSGQRIYTKDDIEIALQIKHLLYEEKYTIDGVRRKLGNLKNISDDNRGIPLKSDNSDVRLKKVLDMIRDQLRAILKNIS
jgi:DNA-binding transcriptional MerR regulator